MERRSVMLGASFERIKGTETIENGFRFFRETLENGIRVVTVESQKLDEAEGSIKVEGLAFSPLEPSEAGYREALRTGLESGSDMELESAILLSAKSMGAHIRGVCGTDTNPAEVSGDGVVYVSKAALGSMSKDVIEKEVMMILEQLKQYVHD